jgi:hypothetical protein
MSGAPTRMGIIRCEARQAGMTAPKIDERVW